MRKSIYNITIVITTILLFSLITWGVLIASTNFIGYDIHITFKQSLGVTIGLLYLSFILNIFRSNNGR